MRPAHILGIFVLVLFFGNVSLFLMFKSRGNSILDQRNKIAVVVAGMGLTDLCIATEARYTRHPAVSDHVVPFMDYPGAYEHFPTGVFWAPVNR